jgi:hypothetical protein
MMGAGKIMPVSRRRFLVQLIGEVSVQRSAVSKNKDLSNLIDND